MNTLELIKQQRTNYNDIKKQLPWLDSCVYVNEQPAFPDYIQMSKCSSVNAVTLEQSLEGKLVKLKDSENVRILRFDKEKTGRLDLMNEIIAEIIENKLILSFLHTEVEFAEIANFANRNPALNIMIESGPRKILYYIKEVKEILAECPNVYLCSYNFCNWLGVEELCREELSQKIIFGTHSPRFSPDAAMGPIIMGNISWKTKCDIAGNNLRRLIDEDIVICPEINYLPVAPFIIDAHAHNIQPVNTYLISFPTPDIEFSENDWIEFMDFCSLEKLLLTPEEPLFESDKCSNAFSVTLRKHDPDRFFYFEMFNPNGDEKHIQRLKNALTDYACIGIKIHPSVHKVEADHDSYEQVWQIAAKYKKPIMSHSWDISEYNPAQYMSHPDRFRKYLEKYPEVKFVLGHAGGRPGTFENVVQVCNDYYSVWVDISGDYFDNGLIDVLAEKIGIEKILFGSDIDWIDPRCQIGEVIGSNLTDNDIERIFRQNANDLYCPYCKTRA